MENNPESHPTDAVNDGSDDSSMEKQQIELMSSLLTKMDECGFGPNESESSSDSDDEGTESDSDKNENSTLVQRLQKILINWLMLIDNKRLDTYRLLVSTMNTDQIWAAEVTAMRAKFLNEEKLLIGMDETLLADDKEKLYRFVDNHLSEKTQALQRCNVLSAEVKMLRDKFKNVSMELKRRFEMFGERGGRILNLDETKDLVEVGKSFIEIDGELEKLIKLHRLEIEKVLKPMKKFSSIDLN